MPQEDRAAMAVMVRQELVPLLVLMDLVALEVMVHLVAAV